MKTFFTTVITTLASCSLILSIATLTNLNATFLAQATDETDETSVQTAEDQDTTTAEVDCSNEQRDSATSPETTPSESLPSTIGQTNLQETVTQIENDPTFQEYSKVIDLVEQIEKLDEADEATRTRLKEELTSVTAIIGGGKNLLTDKLGNLENLEAIKELAKTITTIAHYREYHELATLVKTAQTIIASNETSTAQISQILQNTVDAANKVNIPVTTTPNIKKTSQSATQVQAQDTEKTPESTKQTNDPKIATMTTVNRPAISHTETNSPEHTTNALANALAHTTTTCVAFGAVVIGRLNIKRQK